MRCEVRTTVGDLHEEQQAAKERNVRGASEAVVPQVDSSTSLMVK